MSVTRQELAAAIGAGRVAEDPATGKPVAKITTTQELVKLVGFCSSKKANLVVKRSKDFWASGSENGDVLLDMGQLNRSVKVHANDLFVSCGPGTAVAELIDELEKHGMTLAALPASNEMSVGEWLLWRRASFGTIANGDVSNEIRSVDLVLGDGKTLETGYEAISNFGTGYDLNRLTVGSCGTFGIPAWIHLFIRPMPPEVRLLKYSLSGDQLSAFLGKVSGIYDVHDITISAGVDSGPNPVVRIAILRAGEANDEIEERVDEIAEGHSATKLESERPNSFKFLSKRGKFEFADEMVLPQKGIPDLLETMKEPLTRIELDFTVLTSGLCAVRALVIPAKARLGHKDIDSAKRKFQESVFVAGGFIRDVDLWTQDMQEGGASAFCALKSAFDPRIVTSKHIVGKVSSQHAVGACARASSSRIGESARGIMSVFPKKRGKLDNGLSKKLVELVGEDNVALDMFRRLLYSHDLAPLPKLVGIPFEVLPDAVVRPRNVEDVQKLVEFAREHKIPIIPRGGASWGFGGAVPNQGGIVLDMSSMNKILEIDEDSRIAICESAVTWLDISEAAELKGLFLPTYPGSARIATVGGWMNTGGAGIGAYGAGTSIRLIEHMQAVLGDGRILNTDVDGASGKGLDLNALISGSEGGLGIVTRAAIRLRPMPEEIRPLAYSFDKLPAMGKSLREIGHSQSLPYNVAFSDGKYFDFVRLLGREAPEVGSLLSVTLAGSAKSNEAEEATIDRIVEKGGGKKEPEDLAVHEWEERTYEMRIRRLGPGGALGEVVLPVTAFSEMMKSAAKIAKELKMLSTLKGVLIDRNSVAFMPFYVADERYAIASLASMGFVKHILDRAVELGGRGSGLGLWFSWNLDNLHGKLGGDIMRSVKLTLDPDDIVNPGKFFEMRMRYGVGIPGPLMAVGLDMLAMVKKAFPKTKIGGLPSGVR
ncbi:MAG: FAD-binding oxidoreductase [Thermoplasmata archaeon]